MEQRHGDGGREREEIQRLQERYIRWTLGVDWKTPGYTVREEAQRGKLRTRAGKRAWKLEEKLKERGGERRGTSNQMLEGNRGKKSKIDRVNEMERRKKGIL